MDSPKGDQVAGRSSPHSTVSPAGRSPVFNFLSNLPPIDSDKSLRYTQRLLETNLPTPVPVFTSPRVDPQRETSFVPRFNIVADDSLFHEHWSTQSSALQISGFDTEVQPCCSAGCVDEYLVNNGEVDSISSASPWMHFTKEVPQFSQSGYTASKETIKKVDGSDHVEREAGGLTSSDQAENSLPLSSHNVVQTAVNLRNDERFEEFPKLTSEIINGYAVSDMNLDTVSGVQHCERYATQYVDAQHDEGNPTCQPFPESLQIDEAFRDSDESSMASLKQRRYNIWKPLGYDQDLTSLSSLYHFEAVRSTQTSGSSAISSSLRSGTGLRVNDVGRSVSDSDIFASKNSTGYPSLQENLMPQRSNFETNYPNTISISAATGTMLSQVHLQEIQASVAATAATSTSNNHLSSPGEYLSLTPNEQKIASSKGRMSTSQNSDTVEELKQVTPTRRRKRTGNTSESDGCRGCHCKRSKCLKLYCECFAAREYCMDSCTCVNCSNRPENEGLILQSRRHIESRNPLAFAPKIVPQDTDSLGNVMEEGNLDTPSSARHKRGCNCKKSKCHKGYCECYQAKVGCSVGCRCEGCENPFGTKTASRKAERCEELSRQKQDVAENGKDERMERFSAAEEGFAGIHYLFPCSKVSRAQLLRGSKQWSAPMDTLAPHLCGEKAPNELASDSSIHHKMDDDDMTAILMHTSSPRQKEGSPPRSRSEEPMSSSPSGLRGGRKLTLQAVRPFPSLTPYSNSKGGVSRSKTAQTDSNGNHHRLE